MAEVSMGGSAKNRYGLWVDSPRPRANELDAWVRLWADDRKLDFVSILLNAGTDPKYKPTWDTDLLLEATHALMKKGVEVRWMSYPVATPIAVDRLVDALHDLYTAATLKGLDSWDVVPEFDLEENWGGATQELSDRLAAGVTQIPWVSRFAVNFVPTLKGKAPGFVAPLLHHPRCKIAALQAYTFYGGEGHWTDHAAFRPGGAYLDACLDLAQSLFEDVTVDEIVFGQALYSQNHPAPSPRGTEALQATYDHLYAQGVRRFCGWSGKHTTQEYGGAVWGPQAEAWVRKTAGGDMPAPTLRGVQAVLKWLGLYKGAVDDVWGNASKSAHLKFCQQRGIDESAWPSETSYKALLEETIRLIPWD